ncbi:HK97 family phage prohead protease [Hymenobacter mellowenesis]|uniref:HK97 family phage prohead protease n=1 Tax=Hymenobacter mellowenesis TaxID=3063995 RepID=UPI00350FC0FB
MRYVSAYSNVDSHNDILQKGAYANTIRENKSRIKFLWNHDSTEIPLGVPEEIEEDNFGLKVTSKIIPTTKRNDLLICYENGAINEHSVGFYTTNKKSNDSGQRIIIEAHLLEYSAV